LDDGHINYRKQKTTKVQWLMVTNGRSGISDFVLFCFLFLFFWVGYELSKVFMIDGTKFVMVFLVGKTCMVWHC
jgi:hypothetical protein